MAEIRTSPEHYKILKKLFDKSPLNKEIYKLTVDQSAVEPVLFLPDSQGRLSSVLSGLEAMKRYIQVGFNRVQRRCPLNKWHQCKAEACSFYLVKGITGDCIYIWDHMQRSILSHPAAPLRGE